MTYRARRFGDDINTDYIIASRRKRDTLDPLMLRRFLFEEIAPEFAASIEPVCFTLTPISSANLVIDTRLKVALFAS